MDAYTIRSHRLLEGLTPRQKQFVALRVEHPLAPTYRLGILAGYRPGSVLSNGGRVLKSAKIKNAIRLILLEKSLR